MEKLKNKYHKIAILLFSCTGFLLACNEKRRITKPDLLDNTFNLRNDHFQFARKVFLDQDSIRKKMGIPILSSLHYSDKLSDGSYPIWYYPDSTKYPRLERLQNFMKFYSDGENSIDSVNFGFEEGELLLSDTVRILYGYHYPQDTMKYILYCREELDENGKKKIDSLGYIVRACHKLSKPQFDSVVKMNDSKAVLNY